MDVDRAGAEAVAKAHGAKAYTDYRQMLDAGGLDAVIVSSPIQFHEEQCRAAFEAGCHVLCEKPLASTSAAARRVLDVAEQHGKLLAIGFNHRHYPSIRYLKDALDQGRIGKLDHVRVFGGHDGLNNFRADWMYKGDICGGGAMMDAGIHMTDLARFVVGEIDEVYGVATNGIWNVDKSEDNAMALFKSSAGPTVQYHATWTEWKGYRFYVEAYGDLGMVRGYYAPMSNLLVTHDKPGGPRRKERRFYPEIILREKFKGWQTTSKQSFVDELRDFLLRLEGKDVALADGWAGVRSVEIAEGVYESQRTGKAVKLTPPPA
jgi:predicted dehydrogenase